LYAILSCTGKIGAVTEAIVWPEDWNGKKVLPSKWQGNSCFLMPEFMEFTADVMVKMEKVGRFESEVPAPEPEFRALEPKEFPAPEPEVPALEPEVSAPESEEVPAPEPEEFPAPEPEVPALDAGAFVDALDTLPTPELAAPDGLVEALAALDDSALELAAEDEPCAEVPFTTEQNRRIDVIVAQAVAAATEKLEGELAEAKKRLEVLRERKRGWRYYDEAFHSDEYTDELDESASTDSRVWYCDEAGDKHLFTYTDLHTRTGRRGVSVSGYVESMGDENPAKNAIEFSFHGQNGVEDSGIVALSLWWYHKHWKDLSNTQRIEEITKAELYAIVETDDEGSETESDDY
jgi:hypothetical protein